MLVNVSSYTKCNSFIQEALSVQVSRNPEFIALVFNMFLAIGN